MKFYERVISDFGGYEKCKDILSQPNIDFIMNAQGLREHMLEYRRQHNIFEVGDYVFHTVCNNPLLEKITWIDGVRIITNLAGRPTLIETFRHATDAEINAGKRLGVS